MAFVDKNKAGQSFTDKTKFSSSSLDKDKASTPLASFVFSDGLNFLFSDGSDYQFNIQRLYSSWLNKTKN